MNVSGDFSNAINKLEGLARLGEESYRDYMISPILEQARQDAQGGFDKAMDFSVITNPLGQTTSDKPTTVSWSKDGEGYRFEAEGEDVLFEEFGTGIHYNPNGNETAYLYATGLRGGIGEYGNGNGSKHVWGFYDPEKPNKGHSPKYTKSSKQRKSRSAVPDLFLTHGNPAFLPVYNAKQYILENIFKRIKNQ